MIRIMRRSNCTYNAHDSFFLQWNTMRIVRITIGVGGLGLVTVGAGVGQGVGVDVNLWRRNWSRPRRSMEMRKGSGSQRSSRSWRKKYVGIH